MHDILAYVEETKRLALRTGSIALGVAAVVAIAGCSRKNADCELDVRAARSALGRGDLSKSRKELALAHERCPIELQTEISDVGHEIDAKEAAQRSADLADASAQAAQATALRNAAALEKLPEMLGRVKELLARASSYAGRGRWSDAGDVCQQARDALDEDKGTAAEEQTSWIEMSKQADALKAKIQPQLARLQARPEPLTILQGNSEEDPQRKICPYAAKRAIERLGRCGVNVDGFTPELLCSRMTYNTLNYAGSRSCPELQSILFGKP